MRPGSERPDRERLLLVEMERQEWNSQGKD